MAEMRPNRVKQKLQAGGIATILMGLADADMIDMVGPLGAEGAWLESEHGPTDFADIADLSRACDLWGMTSIARVNSNDEGLIYRTLDRGAQGVVIPHVNTREEAQAVVDAAKFAPIGRRGMFTSRQGYGVQDYFTHANDNTLVGILIEDIVAVENLDEVLKVDNIDVFFVAPSDLAQSMGYIAELGHPKVKQTIDEALSRIVAAGRVAGTLASDDTVNHFIDLGVRLFSVSTGTWLLKGARAFMDNVEARGRARS